MENISHTMLGFVLAKTGLERRTRFATTALVLGSNLPDVDAVALIKGTLTYIDCHRGVTHSVAGGAVLAAAFGAGLWAFDRAIVAPFERWRGRRLGDGAQSVQRVGADLGSPSAGSNAGRRDREDRGEPSSMDLDAGRRDREERGEPSSTNLDSFISATVPGDHPDAARPIGRLLGRALPNRAPERPGPARARLLPLVGLSLLALLAHLGFDLLNDYGIRLLLPFSGRWIYGDIIFIVDPWFWMILGGSLYLVSKPGLLRGAFAWAGWALLSLPVLFEHSVPAPARAAWLAGLVSLVVMRWRGVGRGGRARAGASLLVPRIALVLLVTYIGCMLVLHQLALRRAQAVVPALAAGGPVRRLSVIPRPADPFHWNFIYEDDTEIGVGVVSSLGGSGPPDVTARYTLNMDLPEVRAALETPVGIIARGFCRYIFAELERTPAGEAVSFRDARFAARNRKEFSIFTVPIPPGGGEPGS